MHRGREAFSVLSSSGIMLRYERQRPTRSKSVSINVRVRERGDFMFEEELQCYRMAMSLAPFGIF